MRRMVRAVVAIALSTVAIAAVTGCGGGESSSSTSTSGSGKRGVTITLWHNSADPPALKQLYGDFERDTGNKIKLVTIPSAGFEKTTLTKWASGARPDVLEYHPTVTNLLALNPTKTLRDLSSEAFVAKSGDLYKTAATVDGKTYGAIIGFPQVFGIFYNKDVFEKAGIAAPPQNAAELMQACNQIKAKAPGVTPIAESGGSIWPPQVLPSILMGDANGGNEWGQQLRSNKAHLDDTGSPFIKAMETYKQLKGDGCFNKDLVTATVEKSVKGLVDGSVAMTALHSDMIPAIAAAAGNDPAKVDSSIGFFVVGEQSPAATYIPGPIGSYYLPKTGNDDREAAALQFVRYVTGKGYGKYIEASKTFPIIAGTPEPTGISQLQKDVKAAYDKGPANIAYAADVPGVGGVAALINKLMIGETTPQEMAKQTQQQIAQASKAARIPGW
jgi:raffinose/stachyose/melibiose transport system substrate-binding protein